jgi:uncharacterized delta-60 repeat protein
MTRLRLVGLIVLVVVLATASVSLAGEGDLDPSFSGDGIDLPPVPDHSFGSAVAIEASGNIVAVGSGGTPARLVLVRYRPDGVLDSSFSDDGIVVAPVTVPVGDRADVAIDDVGNIVVVGTDSDANSLAVVRFLPDGTLDTSFSDDGVAMAQVETYDTGGHSLVIDGSGRIVVSGTVDNGSNDDVVVMRFLPGGTLDSTFADDGLFVLDGGETDRAGDVALDDAGRIVFVASTGTLLQTTGGDIDTQVVRLLPNGTLDASFGSGGAVVTDTGPDLDSTRALVVDPQGRIVVAGHSGPADDEDVLVLRYLSDGTLDASFSDDGIVTTAITDGDDNGNGVAIDRAGNVVVVGHGQGHIEEVWHAAVLRYRPDGSLDSSFSGDGIATTRVRGAYDWFNEVAIDTAGDIVVAGITGGGVGPFFLMVARYQGAGWFIDDTGSVFEDDINALAAAGITRGCNPPDNDRYCPTNQVSRGQMAAFLTRALELPTTTDDAFTDDDDSVFEDDINRLAAAGITAGCNPPDNDQYCPQSLVSRGQMAAFLSRALDLPRGPIDAFTDDEGSVFEDDINRLAAADITAGCNPPDNDHFCPSDKVSRGQMAAFLVRALNL